jgi:chromosome segregation ATPase
MLLAGSFNVLEIGLFFFVLLVLAGTIWLFLSSMDNLKHVKEEQRRQYESLTFQAPSLVASPVTLNNTQRKERLVQQFKTVLALFKRPGKVKKPAPVMPNHKPHTEGKHSLEELRSVLNRQQQTLQQLKWQLDESISKEEEVLKRGDEEKIEELEMLLEEKEAEIKQLLQQQKITEKIMVRLEEVQKEFRYMQERMASMEKQASGAQQMAMELEDLRESYTRLEKDHQKKTEKLQEYMNESSRLHQQLCDTEDKLQESNLQRQQLLKKIKLMEEMNNDMQYISDANKHLQTELRRIGELESMLNMITEERDQLLRKRF